MAIRQLFLRASAAAAAAALFAASRLIVAPMGMAYELTGAAGFSSAPRAFDERNNAQITNAAPVSDFENGMSPSCFVSSGAPCSTKTQSSSYQDSRQYRSLVRLATEPLATSSMRTETPRCRPAGTAQRRMAEYPPHERLQAGIQAVEPIRASHPGR